MQQRENHPDSNLPRRPERDVEGGGSGATPVLNGFNNEEKPAVINNKGSALMLWVFIFRVGALAGAFLSFILMVCISDFTLYPDLTYVFAIALLSTTYMVVQVGIKGHELRTKKDVIPPEVSVWIDFSGDQFMAYILFSSASVGASFSTSIRNSGYVSTGLDLAAASTSMSFLAFACVAFVALTSAHRLFSRV